jgi:hypothetical protein
MQGIRGLSMRVGMGMGMQTTTFPLLPRFIAVDDSGTVFIISSSSVGGGGSRLLCRQQALEVVAPCD